jgi:hypothetical protein
MIALIVIGCILLFFAFILSLCVKVTVEYADELKLYVRVLFIKIKILPKKDKKRGPHSMSERRAKSIRKKLKKKADQKRAKALEKKNKKQLEKAQPKKKKTLGEILDIISMVKDIVKAALGRFFGHLKVDLARFHINVATGDAASTAIAYGAICDALLHLLHILEPLKGFDSPKAQDISVTPDYLSDKMSADIKVTFSIRVWHVFHVAFAALGKLIKHLVKMRSGQQTKPEGHK